MPRNPATLEPCGFGERSTHLPLVHFLSAGTISQFSTSGSIHRILAATNMPGLLLVRGVPPAEDACA